MSGFAGLRLAVGLLTVVPVRPPDDLGRGPARTAMVLAPVAVLPVALVAAGVGWLGVGVGLPASSAGVLVVAVVAFGTRAMHLDGLADTADGLGSGKPADQALAIMRRGDIGPMGTVTLVLVLAAEALASGVVLGRPFGWLWLVALLCASRGVLALACLRGVPAARPDGLGALVADSVPLPTVAAVWVVLAALLTGVGVLAGQAWWLPLIGVVMALGLAWWLLQRCVDRLGGITGDVLGALVELSAAVLLVVAAVP
ncbi:MAG: adenosylcobinamide-GDP ribazoletransferase [Actinobacteria bacterium]|nr:adenosylcobinamide-GDP ribazoletransferase [Actinomycetota bacterium]